jgi:hypothetical protein
MLKSQNSVIKPLNHSIKVFYNNGSCYKCQRIDKMVIDGSFGFCSRCKVNLLLYDNITEDEYQKIVTEKISKEFEGKIKKESFNKFINEFNASI